MKNRILLVAFVIFAVNSLAGAGERGESHMFWGGSFGAAFGTVDYIQISPVVGFYPVEKLATGLRLTYQYRNDNRYTPDLNTSDYGAGLFARYHFIPQVFAQGEYDFLNYEYPTLSGGKERDTIHSLLGGGGFSQPLGNHVALHFTVLYDFLYDSGDLYRPYNSPWVYRIGVGVGF